MAARTRRCIYCGGQAESKDHVPPRCLLERPYSPNLATVPACTRCNRSFAIDEEYFIVVLASIGTTPSLTARVADGGSVDRALSRSPALDARVSQSLLPVSGRVVLQPEYARLQRVVQKIAVGLFYLRYGKHLHIRCVDGVGLHPFNIEDQRPPHLFPLLFTERFRPKRWTHLQRRTFSYGVSWSFIKRCLGSAGSRIRTAFVVPCSTRNFCSKPSPLRLPIEG
jgi:hypothetical protein